MKSVYNIIYDTKKQMKSPIYKFRSFSNENHRPNSRKESKIITETTNIFSMIYGPKYTYQDINTDSIFLKLY